VKELRSLTKEELEKKLREARLELMKERGAVASGRAVKNTSKIRNLRRLIARILTIKREKG
jgi:large subunit ribosomal protein L29